MGIKGFTKWQTSDEVFAWRSRKLDTLRNEDAACAVVDLMTRFDSIWHSLDQGGGILMDTLLEEIAKYLDRLFYHFEYVAVCMDTLSPISKGVEQASRRKKSGAIPLGAQERAVALEGKIVSALARLRVSRDVYRFVRKIIVETVMNDYVIPKNSIGKKLYVMAHPDHPNVVQVVDKNGERHGRECPHVREGDGQCVWMAEALGHPTVIISNDRDTEMMLFMMMVLRPDKMPEKLYHYRCNERYTTFMGANSRYKPSLATAPTRFVPRVQVAEMFGAPTVYIKPNGKRSREDITPQPAKKRQKKLKKKKSVYEMPLLDIRGMMETVFTSRDMVFHFVWLAFMFGCDFVHVTNWIKGISADKVWEDWDESITWVEVTGDGPYDVQVDARALINFLEDCINRKSALADLPKGPMDGRVQRPNARMYKGTIKRTLWTMLYMINGCTFPEAVPDPLEHDEDGLSVWGWRMLGGKVRETDVVTSV